MESLALFFSASGRISPRPFALGVVTVYVLSFLSQALISPPATAHWGPWLFALAQAPLIWAWFALHAKRLRDAGQPVGLVIAIAILYALALILLMLLLEPIIGQAPGTVGADAPPGSFADLWIVLLLFAALAGQPNVGFFDVLAVVMLATILIPIAIALGFSVWTGTRPRADDAPAVASATP
jgi:uncharacterized membrane protein YhaH (DUF805 family)